MPPPTFWIQTLSASASSATATDISAADTLSSTMAAEGCFSLRSILVPEQNGNKKKSFHLQCQYHPSCRFPGKQAAGSAGERGATWTDKNQLSEVEPSFWTIHQDPTKCTVALRPVSMTLAHVWIATSQGMVWRYVLDATDNNAALAPPQKVRLWIPKNDHGGAEDRAVINQEEEEDDDDDDDHDDADTRQERVTCLTIVEDHTAVVGTNQGRIIWVAKRLKSWTTQVLDDTTITNGSSGSGTSSGSSIWTRLLSSSSRTRSTAAVQHLTVVPFDQDTKKHAWTLTSLTETGEWTRLQVARAPQATATFLCTRMDGGNVFDWVRSNINTTTDITPTQIQVWADASSQDAPFIQGGCYHALVHVSFQDSTAQLYWLTKITNAATPQLTCLENCDALTPEAVVGMHAAANGGVYLVLRSHLHTSVWAQHGNELVSTTLTDTRAVASSIDPTTFGIHVWTSTWEEVYRVERAVPPWQVAVRAPTGTDVDKLALHLHNKVKHAMSSQDVTLDWREPVTADHEAAILQVSDALSTRVTYHEALVELLQCTGIQRWLSLTAKWMLYSHGQKATTHAAVQTLMTSEQDNIVELLEQTQADHQERGDSKRFVNILLKVIGGLNALRADALQVYLLDPDSPPPAPNADQVPIWSTHLSRLLHRQVLYWSENEIQTDPEISYLVAAQALQEARNLYLSCREGYRTKDQYLETQKNCIDYLRDVNKDDAAAFQLCKEHAFFEGLCTISMDHYQRKRAVEFSLSPMFHELIGDYDVATGQHFDEFALRWLFNHGHNSIALKYGRDLCKETLANIVHEVSRFHKYRYLCAMDDGDFDSASRFQLEAVNKSTLRDAKLSANMALLFNTVAQLEDKSTNGSKHQQLQEHGFAIEAKREVVGAQELLMGEAGLSKSVMESKELVIRILEAAETVDDEEQTTALLLSALGSCLDIDESIPIIVRVWLAALAKDSAFWTDLLRRAAGMQDKAIQQEILQSSLYGKMLELLQDLKNNSKVVAIGLDCVNEVRNKVLHEAEAQLGWSRLAMARLLEIAD